MSYIELAFNHAMNLPPPRSIEFLRETNRESLLMEQIETALGKNFVEELNDVQSTLCYHRSRAFFLEGVHFFLEILQAQ